MLFIKRLLRKIIFNMKSQMLIFRNKNVNIGIRGKNTHFF